VKYFEKVSFCNYNGNFHMQLGLFRRETKKKFVNIIWTNVFYRKCYFQESAWTCVGLCRLVLDFFKKYSTVDFSSKPPIKGLFLIRQEMTNMTILFVPTPWAGWAGCLPGRRSPGPSPAAAAHGPHSLAPGHSSYHHVTLTRVPDTVPK
jgi:hypothetical protein